MIRTKLADRYEIVGELGRGGMGVVYRAKDPVLSREVAVKLIPPAALSPEMEERFQREAQTVAQMDHPAIVPIYDLGSHDGSLFFVMPVVGGTNLRHLLQDGSLVLGDVLEIGIQVAEALDYSHARGVVHRDIKPENIMIAREGGTIRARVMDFGLARASSENRLTKTGTLVGTAAYFSPEQITAHNFDGRSDIYSLGTVLYECVAGEPPFGGEMQSILYRIVHQIPQPPRSLGADIREELEEILMSCLEKDPAKRPQQAGLLAEALRMHRAKLQSDEFRRSVVLTASRMIARPAAAAPFIGRQKEFAELQRRLNAAIAGECQFAVVAGEPGIGKTRLLEELARLAHALNVRVLRGRFVEQDRVFAHQGFCEVIQDYFRSKDPGNASGERPDFSDLAPELLALFPVLGEIGELRSAASSGVRAGGGDEAFHAEDKTAIFELIARTLTRMAAGRPLLLILENLHGAEISIEALPYIVRRLGPTPTCIVGTYRQTEIDRRHPLARMLDSFEDDPRFSTMTLGPFSPSEHKALVETIAGGAKVSESVARRLFDTTEGNPFFTKELVRSMIDTGGMARDKTGEWGFSHGAGISSDALPATIQQAIEKRIQRLPEETRGILSIASVLGKSFEYRDLETILDDRKDLEEIVDGLVSEGILEEDRESRGDRLAFSSGIVRDVLYGELSRRKRRSLHRRFAEVLETRHAGRLERVYPELVHHFSEGDVPEKTVAYGLELARKSLEAFSPEEAIRATKTALEYLEDEEWAGDRSLEGEARMLLAQAHRLAGHTDGALVEAESAVKIFEREKQIERSVGSLLFAAESAWQERRIDETRRFVERGIEAGRAIEKPELQNRLLSLAVTVANLRGEYSRAAAYLAEIERLAPREAASEEAIPSGGRLVVALSNPVPAAEPVERQTVEDSEVIGTVFETLLATDAQGNVAPLLAESWQVSADGKRVELSLRADQAFSDGAPLTAGSVKDYVERNVRIRKSGTPAAFSAIRGVAEFLAGEAAEISGIRAAAERKIEIELVEPLPIYPAFLTDIAAGIGKVSEGERVLGTGAYRFASRSADRIVLERNPHFRRAAPGRLDSIEFRTSMTASAIAAGLRSGEIDLARDLLPQDLEELARDPRFRSGFVETPKKDTYFVLFNTAAPAGGSEALRRALAGSFRNQDLVWSTLGRFALPANGLLPPGILGHDAGRRRVHLAKDAAAQMVADSGLALPVRLKASMHPVLRDRCRSLTSSLLSIWRELGVEVDIQTSTMAEYLKVWNQPGDVDILMGRWHADYDDPDNFTDTLFHSAHGLLKAYFTSADADRLLEEARSEKSPAAREELYRTFENLLLDSAVLVPLFHDVDYRVASPAVRGLELRSRPPFVNYAEIGKAESAAPAGAPAARPWAAGILHVPIPGSFPELDPALSDTFEQAETLSMIFETLTRDVRGGQVVPWLASEVHAEEGGRRFRFRLRPGVRFHDGRRLTSRDVRFSFERLLQDSRSTLRYMLSSVRGAERIFRGEASELEGFRILSPLEFVVELEKPIGFFPVLLSYPALAVLPEGTGRVGTSWQDQCVGTGPFRAVGYEAGRRLELERNPLCWREGFPKSEGLVFHFGATPEQIRNEFLAGRYSIASDLRPADAEAFRQNPLYASNYREVPRLTTYLIGFKTNGTIFEDESRRRELAGALDVGEIVRRTLGRIAVPAMGVIPPGLLGAETTSASAGPKARPSTLSDQHTVSREPVELTAVVHPIFFGEYSAFYGELLKAFRELGFTIRRIHGEEMSEFLNANNRGRGDLFIGRWNADYPDADSFVYNLLHSRGGLLGKYCSSPEIDRLAEQGRAELDPRVRHTIYRKVEELLSREARLVPLFHDRLYRFARPEVEGLVLGFGVPVVSYEELRIRL
jgi:ABC-type transport system substrate-binding protein